MPTHSILSTGPFLADPGTEEGQDTQTGGGTKTPGARKHSTIVPEEDVMRIGEEDPDQPQTGGTVKTGRKEEIQPETEE